MNAGGGTSFMTVVVCSSCRRLNTASAILSTQRHPNADSSKCRSWTGCFGEQYFEDKNSSKRNDSYNREEKITSNDFMMCTTTMKAKTMLWVEHGARIERWKRSLYEMFNRR